MLSGINPYYNLPAVTESVPVVSNKLSNAVYTDHDDLEDTEYEIDTTQQDQDDQDQVEGEDAEEESLSDEEVDDIVQGSMHVLLPEGRSKTNYRDTITEYGSDAEDEDFKTEGEEETEDDDEEAVVQEDVDEEMQDIDDQEIVDLVSGTEFVTKEELFSTSSKVLKSGKLMGAEISEITSKIQDLRAGSNEDEVEM